MREYYIYVWKYDVDYGQYWLTIVDTSKENAAIRIVNERNVINQEDIVRLQQNLKYNEDEIIRLKQTKDGFKYENEIKSINYEIENHQDHIRFIRSKLDYLIHFKDRVLEQIEERPLTDIITTGWEE